MKLLDAHDLIPLAGPARRQRSGRQLEGSISPPMPTGAGTGPQVGIGCHYRAVGIEECDVERKPHPHHVDRPAGPKQQAFTWREAGATHQSLQARPPTVGDHDAIAQNSAPLVGSPQKPNAQWPSASKIWMIAEPRITTNIAGKMSSTSGKTSLIVVLAAASSARWRRLVRSVSACTLSACAIDVPKRSV